MAALQSEAGRALLLRAGRTSNDISSLVLVEKDGYVRLTLSSFLVDCLIPKPCHPRFRI